MITAGVRCAVLACQACPVTPYQPAEWHDLFVAMAGASAALTGLIFVAVSINLAQILKYRALPVRAGETLSVLLGLLLLSVIMLVPGQGYVALGVEILLLGTILAAGLLWGRLLSQDSAPVLRPRGIRG